MTKTDVARELQRRRKWYHSEVCGRECKCGPMIAFEEAFLSESITVLSDVQIEAHMRGIHDGDAGVYANDWRQCMSPWCKEARAVLGLV